MDINKQRKSLPDRVESDPLQLLPHFLHLCLYATFVFCAEIFTGIVPFWSRKAVSFDPWTEYGILFTAVLYALRIVSLLGLTGVTCDFIGLVFFNAFPPKPVLRVPLEKCPHLRFRHVTRGLFPEMVIKTAVNNMNLCRSYGVKDFAVEVVTDRAVNLPQDRNLVETVVPEEYETKSGALWKSRALQYCLEPDVDKLDDRTYVVHLDEETRLTESAITGIVNFATEGKYPCAEGLVTYANDMEGANWRHWLCTIADSFRVTEDYGKYQFQFKVLHRPVVGWRGSFMIISAAVERMMTFEIGLEGSVTEDTYWSLLAWDRGIRWGDVEGEMLEKSPFNLSDFVKQRKRWLQGNYLAVVSPKIPLKRRLILGAIIFSWFCKPAWTLSVLLSIWYPLPNATLLNFIMGFMFGSHVYSFMYGWIRTLTLHPMSPLTMAITIPCVFVAAFWNFVAENISALWATFSDKYAFYIVAKDHTSKVDIIEGQNTMPASLRVPAARQDRNEVVAEPVFKSDTHQREAGKVDMPG